MQQPPEEDPPIPQISETSTEASLPEIPTEAPARARAKWIAPAWFFFGIIVGIAGFAAYNALTVKAPLSVAQTESLDPNVDAYRRT